MLLYAVSVAGFAMYSESLTPIAAHRRAWSIGILHRDLSPWNIMIVEKKEDNIEHGLLIDWDLCKVFREDNTHVACQYSRTVSSTLHTISPES